MRYAEAETRRILDRISQSGAWIHWTDHYSEPGYTTGDDPPGRWIVMADWNARATYDPRTRTRTIIDDTMPRLGAILERLGHSTEWADEWETCQMCAGAFRTSPDCYAWRRSAYPSQDGWICHECAEDDPDILDMIREELTNNPRSAWTLPGDPCSLLGLVQANRRSFENGLHPGQDDDPERITQALRQADIDHLYWIPYVGQFDIAFHVLVAPADLQRAQQALTDLRP